MFTYKPASINIKKFNMDTIKYPLSVYLKITNKCNLNCCFCSQSIGQDDMDLEFAKRQLEILKELGVVYIYYTGGEPLLYKNLDVLLRYGHELGFKQILVTNGLLLSENTKFLRYIACIGVSLHGKELVHDTITNRIGCFSKVTSNLDDISSNNRRVSIDINYTAEKINMNYEDIKYVAQYCQNNNYQFSIARLNYIGKGKNYKQDINELFGLVHSIKNEGYKVKLSNCTAHCVIEDRYRYLTHGCSAGIATCAIEVNGDVKICASSNYVLGNLYTDKFNKIWSKKELKILRQLKLLPPQCLVCKDVFQCRGACRAEGNEYFWREICDDLVIERFNNVWAKIKDQKIYLNISMLRKDFGTYTIISFPTRKCNSKAKEFISSIDGSKTGNEILDLYDDRLKGEIKNFMIALKIDNLICLEGG